MRAIRKMQRAAADNELRAIMEYREKAELDDLQRIKNAHREGELRGEKRGKELVALQMLSLNINIDTIIAATGLSKADIQKLER